jgi:hypothetical protein
MPTRTAPEAELVPAPDASNRCEGIGCALGQEDRRLINPAPTILGPLDRKTILPGGLYP